MMSYYSRSLHVLNCLQNQNPSHKKLIIPGQQIPSNSQKHQKLIIPQKKSGKDYLNEENLILTTTDNNKQNTDDTSIIIGRRQQFRPPPGYFSESKSTQEQLNTSTEDAIKLLNDKNELWHEKAKYLSNLLVEFDSKLIFELTKIKPKEQNIMIVSAAIRTSIIIYCQNNLNNEIMAYYDKNESYFLLYEFRFLEDNQRYICAKYVAKNKLKLNACIDVARAVKEYARRKNMAQGFTSCPEDCLAFKFYRQAIESREKSLIELNINKGLEIAFSESAKDRLRELLNVHEKLKMKDSVKKGKINLVSITNREIDFFPIPVLGKFNDVDSKDIIKYPKVKQNGIFNVFSFPEEIGNNKKSIKWIGIPNWDAIKNAKNPFCLEIKNCSEIPQIIEAIHSNTLESKRKFQGPGIMIADANIININDNEFYLINNENLVIKDGFSLLRDLGFEMNISIDDDHFEKFSFVLAKILFISRSPISENIDDLIF